LNEGNCQPSLLYPVKLSFRIEREIKTFHDKLKLTEFMTTKPALQKIIKRILHIEEKDKHRKKNMSKNKSV
jgi:hypothetical protein